MYEVKTYSSLLSTNEESREMFEVGDELGVVLLFVLVLLVGVVVVVLLLLWAVDGDEAADETAHDEYADDDMDDDEVGKWVRWSIGTPPPLLLLVCVVVVVVGVVESMSTLLVKL